MNNDNIHQAPHGLEQNDQPIPPHPVVQQQHDHHPSIPQNIPQPQSNQTTASVLQQSPAVSQPTEASLPAPSMMPQPVDMNGSRESVPVVKVWSIRGIEYAIMSFMLWAIAISVTWVPVALITGSTGFIALSPPLALMIVSLPVFAVFFMRLKKAELLEPSLRTESTKRRFSQITQIVSFIVCFISALTIVSTALAAIGGEGDGAGKTIASAVVFIVVWAALFVYYWRDERKF